VATVAFLGARSVPSPKPSDRMRLEPNPLPALNLFAPDREHPSLAGTYLQTCVVYAAVTRNSPVPLRYAPAGISPEDALFLRQIAWETVRDWTP